MSACDAGRHDGLRLLVCAVDPQESHSLAIAIAPPLRQQSARERQQDHQWRNSLPHFCWKWLFSSNRSENRVLLYGC